MSSIQPVAISSLDFDEVPVPSSAVSSSSSSVARVFNLYRPKDLQVAGTLSNRLVDMFKAVIGQYLLKQGYRRIGISAGPVPVFNGDR